VNGLLLAIAVLTLPAQAAQNVPVPTAEHCSVDKNGTDPRYPDSLKGSGIQGTVVVQATVGLDGCASDISVVRKLHPELDKIAKQAVSSWKFQPAMKNGRPVKALVQVEVKFRDSSGGTPKQVSAQLLALTRGRTTPVW
jgi:TonB family protein